MKRSLCLAFIAMISLSGPCGCASKYGEPQTPVNYYPACYSPIQDLREREYGVAKSTGGGALLGALGGALIGLMASGGKWQGAVVGGAMGATTGVVAGNIYGARQQRMYDNQRMAAYFQDLDGDVSNMDITAAAARTALNCYDRQFRALVSQIKAARISREGAARRFAEISAGREEAIALLGDAVDRGENINLQYEQALMEESEEAPQKSSATGAPASSRPKKTLLETTARKKQRAVNGKTESYRQEKAEAQNNTSRQIEEMNDILRSSKVLDEART